MSMLRSIGEALRLVRPGVDALVTSRFEGFLGNALRVSSPSFRDGDAIPRTFTADGNGRFPGVSWSGLPPQTQSLVLLVEDADIPFFRPVTHLIVHSIAPGLGGSSPARSASGSADRHRGVGNAGAISWAGLAGRRRRRRRVTERIGMRSRFLH